MPLPPVGDAGPQVRFRDLVDGAQVVERVPVAKPAEDLSGLPLQVVEESARCTVFTVLTGFTGSVHGEEEGGERRTW
ncbi:hypothetical protein Sgou_44970 [Streptomyces gougerotii]|uniref:Uncharacterized protein n=1 Tax=Streptomyces gougerotii TaxID=53448 RepID=A0ABQ1DB92_9ACTN|nr:hypothetical protein Sgou_44970 [Streptomyces gougerotii]